MQHASPYYCMEPSLGIFGSLPMPNLSRFHLIFNCQVLDTFLNFPFVPNDVNFDCNCINPVGTSTRSTDLVLLPEPF